MNEGMWFTKKDKQVYAKHYCN